MAIRLKRDRDQTAVTFCASESKNGPPDAVDPYRLYREPLRISKIVTVSDGGRCVRSRPWDTAVTWRSLFVSQQNNNPMVDGFLIVLLAIVFIQKCDAGKSSHRETPQRIVARQSEVIEVPAPRSRKRSVSAPRVEPIVTAPQMPAEEPTTQFGVAWLWGAGILGAALGFGVTRLFAEYRKEQFLELSAANTVICEERSGFQLRVQELEPALDALRKSNAALKQEKLALEKRVRELEPRRFEIEEAEKRKKAIEQLTKAAAKILADNE
jgi:hypothetical protein